ncbi:MAG: hypothetical protein HYY17_02415 [Planctomycetes bacterium]|nr:hypothetical protein [Planctomycetota bacterium]
MDIDSDEPFKYDDFTKPDSPRNWAEPPTGGIDACKEIVLRIREIPAEVPIALGVFGDWGSGKTSVLKGVEHYCAARPAEYKVCWFDAWKYQNESNLIVPLLLEMEQALPTKDKLLESAAKIAKAVALGLGDSLLRMTASIKVEDILKYESIVLDRSIRYVSEYRELHGKISDAVRSLSAKGRLVLIIDDLDRCLPERAVALLTALQVHFHIPRLVVLLGLNDSVLAGYLEETYRPKESKPYFDGRAFLQKLVQWSIHLPSVPLETIAEPFFGNLGDAQEILKRLPSLPYRTWKRVAVRFKGTDDVKNAQVRAFLAVTDECMPGLARLLRERWDLSGQLREHFTVSDTLAPEKLKELLSGGVLRAEAQYETYERMHAILTKKKPE